MKSRFDRTLLIFRNILSNLNIHQVGYHFPIKQIISSLLCIMPDVSSIKVLLLIFVSGRLASFNGDPVDICFIMDDM